MKKILLLFCYLICQTTFGQSNAKKVLFLGNSYTFYNDMPGLLRSCALSVQDTLVTDQNTISGYTWRQHSENADTKSKLRQGGFDHIILQANSLEFTYTDNTVNTNTLPYGRFLDSMAHKHSPCAQVIFYNTWGRKNGSNGQTYLQQDTLIEKRYKSFANQSQAMVSPVGPVRRYLRTNYPTLELYDPDESHPSAAGSYVSAVCFYTVIFRKDPTLITYNFSLNAADANAIKQAVKVILYNNLSNWNVGAFDPQAPVADFNFASQNETTISLTNASSNANRYEWKFGDNSSDTASAPSHTYALSGTYNVSLTAMYCKLKNTVSKPVTVSSTKPIVTNVQRNPVYVRPGHTPLITATITDDIALASAVLKWGTSSGNLTNSISMTSNGNLYSATIPAQNAGTTVYYRITATDAVPNMTNSNEYSYKVEEVVVTIDPTAVTLNKNGQQQFTATATNPSGQAIAFTPVWSATGGTITSSGLYTAPSTPGTYTIKALQAGVNGTGIAVVTVSPVPVIAGKIEAESYVQMFGVQNENTTDAGGGQNVAYLSANDWMTYDVNVLKTGNYEAEFRVSSNIANVKMELFSGTTSLGVLTVSNATGGWQNWQTYSMNIDLTAGLQTLKFVSLTTGFNINWINFKEFNIPSEVKKKREDVSSVESLVEKMMPNPFSTTTLLHFKTAYEKNIQILSVQGEVVQTFRTSESMLPIGEHLEPGIYFVRISEGDKWTSVKIIKL